MAKTKQDNTSCTEMGSESDTSSCPICLNTFLKSNIQIHASTCNEELYRSKELNINSHLNKEPKKTQISSFFMSPSHKRSLQSVTESTTNKTCLKKPKVEQESLNNETNICNRDPYSVRRPLADLMRPNDLLHYKGQEDIVGQKQGAIWLPIIQSISKPGVAAVPSMILWVSTISCSLRLF